MIEQVEYQWLVPRDDYEHASYQCPTTGEWFHPLSFRLAEIGHQAFVWAYCPLCDDHGRRRDKRDYDSLRPQPHCYTLVNGEP